MSRKKLKKEIKKLKKDLKNDDLNIIDFFYESIRSYEYDGLEDSLKLCVSIQKIFNLQEKYIEQLEKKIKKLETLKICDL